MGHYAASAEERTPGAPKVQTGLEPSILGAVFGDVLMYAAPRTAQLQRPRDPSTPRIHSVSARAAERPDASDRVRKRPIASPCRSDSMKTCSFVWKLALVSALALPLVALAAADETKPTPKPKDILENMRFRNLGPAV